MSNWIQDRTMFYRVRNIRSKLDLFGRWGKYLGYNHYQFMLKVHTELGIINYLRRGLCTHMRELQLNVYLMFF